MQNYDIIWYKARMSTLLHFDRTKMFYLWGYLYDMSTTQNAAKITKGSI